MFVGLALSPAVASCLWKKRWTPAAVAVTYVVPIGVAFVAGLAPEQPSSAVVLTSTALVLSCLAVAALWPDRPTNTRACAHCGYDLRGNTTGRCPECGLSPAHR